MNLLGSFDRFVAICDDAGIIISLLLLTNSPYNSNIIVVDKDDGTKRFVVDYRELNKDAILDTYPLPSIDEMLEQSFGCRYFSQLDLASWYWAIPITEADCYKTTFIPRGKFQFCIMPFGLCNSQATFQRCMENVVAECKKRGAMGLDAYIDNVIISTIICRTL